MSQGRQKGGTTKGHQETSGEDRCAHYLHCGNGLTVLSMSKLTKLCILNMWHCVSIILNKTASENKNL